MDQVGAEWHKASHEAEQVSTAVCPVVVETGVTVCGDAPCSPTCRMTSKRPDLAAKEVSGSLRLCHELIKGVLGIQSNGGDTATPARAGPHLEEKQREWSP